jgi:hypothetical protein
MTTEGVNFYLPPGGQTSPAVDTNGVLSPKERARRAGHTRKAHFARLALLSAQARRRTLDVKESTTAPTCQTRTSPSKRACARRHLGAAPTEGAGGRATGLE